MLRNYIIILFSLCFIQASPTKEKVTTIEFDRLELLENGWQNQKFYFKINGSVFSPDTIIHTIKTNVSSFDEILFSFDSTFKRVSPILTNFIAGNAYTIRINSCSQYELIANKNPKLGQVRFKKINTNEDLYGGLCDTELLTTSVTKYYEPCQSAMCTFSPVEISFSNKDSIIDYKLFHFLHGEKVTATYNGKIKEIELIIDKE